MESIFRVLQDFIKKAYTYLWKLTGAWHSGIILCMLKLV
jgi:hypothetical protein